MSLRRNRMPQTNMTFPLLLQLGIWTKRILKYRCVSNYTYGTSGNYDVQLTAVDTNNCTDTVIQNVFIQPAPVAEISIINPCEYTPLDITDNSSIADTFSIVTYTWNYGDNTSAINPNEDKIYESYGQYNVQLALEADNGCVDTVEQLITVYPKPVLAYDVGPACKNTWTS